MPRILYWLKHAEECVDGDAWQHGRTTTLTTTSTMASDRGGDGEKSALRTRDRSLLMCRTLPYSAVGQCRQRELRIPVNTAVYTLVAHKGSAELLEVILAVLWN